MTPVNIKRLWLLLILSYFFFMLGNGAVPLTSPDEVFYAQTAKEMIHHKSWIVPYLFDQPQFEKPVLLYWFLRLVYSVFGISSFSSRVPPAVFAAVGGAAVYFLGTVMFREEKKAFFSALILMSCALYIGLARTLFTDLIFSVFILLSLASFMSGYTIQRWRGAGLVLFFVFAGFATLTKGPLGLLIPLLTVLIFLGITRDLRFFWCRYSLWGFLLFLCIALPWYVFMIYKFGNSFIHEFFYNDHIRRIFEAEHRANDTWYFYPGSMIICMLPWSVFFVVSVFETLRSYREKISRTAGLFLFCWILVVFTLFQAAHSKLVSYILPLFPAMALFTGDYMYRLIQTDKRRFLMVALASWFILLVLPIALSIAASKYSTYIVSKTPVYNFVYFYCGVLGIMLFFIARRKIMITLCLWAVQIPLILFFVFAAHRNFEDFVSSANAGEYLLRNYPIENTVLCSKSVVRGVRFFTNTGVAVISIGGSDFFSPHPILFLNSSEKVSAFLKSQPVTYGCLSKSSLEDVRRIAENAGRSPEVLRKIGNDYIVRIQ